MKTKFFLMLSAAAMVLGSCSNDDQPIEATEGNAIAIEAIHPSALSRVNDTGFDNGDEIGLFVVDVNSALQPGGNMVNNGCFTFNGSSWTPRRTYYWDNGTYNVYAYYPYNGIIEDTSDYLFELPLDQSTAQGYSSADFLWATAEKQTASNSAVKLKFSHVLSRLDINLVKSDDYEGALPTDFEVYVHGTTTLASIDLSNGGSSTAATTSTSTIKARKLTNTLFTAIVVPQRISSRRPLIEVVSGNVSYLLEGTISFKQGYKATITVTLTKSPEQVQIEIGGGISNWD